MMYTESAYKALAARLNREFHYGKYRMWDHVPFIGHTALVVDCTVHGGGYKLLPPQVFDNRIGERYITEAVLHSAHSLGEFSLRGGRHFDTWKVCLGKYPPGFFTHRVGEDLTQTTVDISAV